MHLARARRADHLDQALARVAADQAVVHHDHRLALDDVAHRIELDLHLGHPERLGGVDERPADVVVPDEAVLELDAGDLGEAERHRVGAVGHAEHHLAAGRRLLPGKLAAELAPDPVHRLAEDGAVGAGEVHQLEHAAADRPGSEPGQLGDLAVLDPDELARLQLAGDVRAEQVERAGLRRDDHPAPRRPITSGRKPRLSTTA